MKILRIHPAAIFVPLFFLLSPCLLSADVIHVPADQLTIQAGIDAAAPGDIVLVADGTYTGDGNRNLDFGGKAITVQSENGPESCLIDCQADAYNPHRAFVFHSGEGPDSVVSGFRITHGFAEGPKPGEKSGGAIYCDAASPTISGNIISGNHAGGWSSASEGGGGIFCRASSPIIQDNIISSNRTGWGARGGGIFCVDAFPVISNCTISWNGMDYGRGGGILSSGGHVRITDSTIEHNQIDEGSGGGAVFDSATIINCTVRDNSVVYWEGGGIICGTGEISGCTITGNFASMAGGGILCGDVIITNCLIDNNSAFNSGWQDGHGGGIHCSAATISNCVITNNRAFRDGGGIYAGGGTIVTNCTIADNMTIFSGGGISCRGGSPRITDNIITGNEAYGGTHPVHFLGNGGGINLYQCAGALISHNTIMDNIAEGTVHNFYGANGGGISLLSSTGLTLTDNIIRLNAGRAGGGIYCKDAEVSLNNNLIIENTATQRGGGGIFCHETSNLILQNCTVEGNHTHSPESGGAIHAMDSALSIRDAIIWDNTPLGLFTFPDAASIAYSDVEDGWPGEGNINADPLFVAGPLGDHYLSQVAAGGPSDSPCVDAGSGPAKSTCYETADGMVCLDQLTTRADRLGDGGRLDMGYHFPMNRETREIFAYLGDPDSLPLDCDVYVFSGEADEDITVSLCNVNKQFGRREEQAILIVTNYVVGNPDCPVFNVDRSSLANHINMTLPCDSLYLVIVKEQPGDMPGRPFIGDYCLTLTSSREAATTFEEWTRE